LRARRLQQPPTSTLPNPPLQQTAADPAPVADHMCRGRFAVAAVVPFGVQPWPPLLNGQIVGQTTSNAQKTSAVPGTPIIFQWGH
jgi:hypothetical protein